MIEPTVGRIVHFFDPQEKNDNKYGPSPRAAIITYVWSNEMVNLTVFERSGYYTARERTHLAQPDVCPPGDMVYCQWMADQIRQAAKTASFEETFKEALKEPADPTENED